MTQKKKKKHEILMGKLPVLEVVRELGSADTETLCKVFNIDKKKNRSTVAWALLRYYRQGLVGRKKAERIQKYGRTPYLYYIKDKGIKRINYLKNQLNLA